MAEGGEPSIQLYQCDSCIRGYHIYQTIWVPVNGEILTCRQESSNPHDRYAVSVHRDEQAVGHLPRKISRLCSLFLGRSGSITATVTGRRQRSVDLPQGGLEVPCRLTFSGSEVLVAKARKLIELLKLDKTEPGMEDKKKSEEKYEKKDEEIDEGKDHRKDDKELGVHAIWVRFGRHSLDIAEKEIIFVGQCLTDNHINFIHALLKNQFPHIGGLINTLTVNTVQAVSSLKSNSLQIIFCRGNHWIVASTVRCPPNTVTIYDSIYEDVDNTTRETVARLVGAKEGLCINMGKMGRQVGATDCGVFAIATLTSLAHGHNEPYHFIQEGMRAHLVECIDNCKLTPFPTMNI